MHSIKYLNHQDLQAFAHMTFPTFQQEMRESEKLHSMIALGAYLDQNPAGLALANIDENGSSATFCSLYVKPELRGRGIGTALTQALTDAIRMKGCRKIAVTYTTKQLQSIFFEKILFRCGWEDGAIKALLLEFSVSHGIPNFDAKLPALPSSIAFLPFCELRKEEREELAGMRGTLYPHELDPFLDNRILEPSNSLAVRQNHEIVGWLVNKRPFPDTILYATLWVRPDLYRLGLGMHLIAKSLQLQINRAEVEHAIQWISPNYPAMIRFAEKRLAPFATAFYESKKAKKSLLN